jgi:hypothetical protein
LQGDRVIPTSSRLNLAQMTIYESATLVALVLGPVSAVIITLWHQERSQKRAAQERLFLTLMAHRRAFPPPLEWANSLNLIDVVFSDRPKVVALWHELYDILFRVPLVEEQRVHKNLELLSAMAKSLGYNLAQVDIDKFYSPQVHGNQQALNDQLQTELLRVLKASDSFGGAPKPDQPKLTG